MLQLLLLFRGDEGTDCLQESLEKDAIVLAFCHIQGCDSNWICSVAVRNDVTVWSFCIFSITHVTAVHLSRLIYSWQCFNYHSSTIIIIAFIWFWIAQLFFRMDYNTKPTFGAVCEKGYFQGSIRGVITAWYLFSQLQVG